MYLGQKGFAKVGDRVMVRMQATGDVAKGNTLMGSTFNLARIEHPLGDYRYPISSDAPVAVFLLKGVTKYVILYSVNTRDQVDFPGKVIPRH